MASIRKFQTTYNKGANNVSSDNEKFHENDTETVQEEEIKEPERFRVLLHNDDYTTMDFVVAVLRSIFNKTLPEATSIMMKVHNQGIGECGVYTQEIAESKVHMVRHEARMAGYPLNCTMEQV